MFEDSLVESAELVQSRKGSAVIASAIVHILLVAVLILIPLAYTEQIQGATLAAFLVAPPPPPSAPPRSRAAVMPKPAENAVPVDSHALIAPTEVPDDIAIIVDPTPIGETIGYIATGGREGNDTGRDSLLSRLVPVHPMVVPAPPPPPPLPPAPAPLILKRSEPMRVSGGVQAGNLILRVPPEYPPLAKTARVEGTVILSATIAEDGTIKELRVVSATSPLLLPGLIESVKTWKYKPTLLNNEPVEVLTTITVNFSLHQN